LASLWGGIQARSDPSQLRSKSSDGEVWLWDAVSGTKVTDSAETEWRGSFGLEMESGWIEHQGCSIYVPVGYRPNHLDTYYVNGSVVVFFTPQGHLLLFRIPN
jgi:hypothetical protein